MAIPIPTAPRPSTGRTGATGRTSAGRAFSAPALGSGWLVIEEGLGGRTTVNDDPVEGIEKNGRTYLYPCLMSHKPLDVVAIMLGTNDLKQRFGKSAWEVAEGVGVLVELVPESARRPQRRRARDPRHVAGAVLEEDPPLHADHVRRRL